MTATYEDDLMALVVDCTVTVDKIGNGLRWAYSAGWFPARRWVADPPGQDMRLAKATRDDDDRVPGPVDDIGLADYHARAAVRAAGPRLYEASSLIDAAVIVAAVGTGMTTMPAAVVARQPNLVGDYLRSLRQIDAQLGFLELGRIRAVGSPQQRSMLRVVEKAAWVLAGVESRLDLWAEQARVNRALPVSMCVTCKLRPRPVRKGRVVAKECDTCATWRYRHGGSVRPLTEDDAEREEPRRAQERRAAAGAGWGWS